MDVIGAGQVEAMVFGGLHGVDKFHILAGLSRFCREIAVDGRDTLHGLIQIGPRYMTVSIVDVAVIRQRREQDEPGSVLREIVDQRTGAFDVLIFAESLFEDVGIIMPKVPYELSP